MDIRVLGASGGLAAGTRTTAFLLGDSILLDGGTGVGDLTADELVRIDRMLLTHAHLDHICGFALALVNVMDRRETPVTIIAPQVVIDALKNYIFNWHIWPDLNQLPCAENPVLLYQPIEPGETLELVDGISVEAVELTHTVPSFAYLLQSGEGKLCFCGDTTTTDRLWARINALQGVDQLFIECSYPSGKTQIAKDSGHYTVEQLAADLGRLDRLPVVCLMHPKPGYETLIRSQLRDHPGLTELSLRPCIDGESWPVF